MAERIVIDVKTLYGETAKLADQDGYIAKVRERAGTGQEVVLTGQGPIWLYLILSHALHGKAKRLIYDSPVTGEVLIYDHDPF
jgi:CRISPR-associated Csx3 family protein